MKTGLPLPMDGRNVMSPRILEVNVKFNSPTADLEEACGQAAFAVTESPGLSWKFWWVKANHEAGGIYEFENASAAQAYLAGPIMAALQASPAISNISTKLIDAPESHAAVTRGQRGQVKSPAM
jgi:Putative mono-oxygenase ydhR